MDIPEIMAVLQGAINQKHIQRRYKDGEEWTTITNPWTYTGWDFACYVYRIKPEPREWWICKRELEEGATPHVYLRRPNEAQPFGLYIKVVEVL